MATEEQEAELACVDLTAEDDDDVVDLATEEDKAVEGDECCICQDNVSFDKQGFLSSCDHRFHFDCIITWSKVTNLCPLCKQKFNLVTRMDDSGQVVHRESIADTKQVFRPDPRDHDVAAQLRMVANVRCELCGRGDDEHVLLMCEAPNCMNAAHTYCVGLTEVPTHSWYCSHHSGGPARASDLLVRTASTLSSRRRTRRLASLMSNIMGGVGAARQGGSGTPSSRSNRSRGRSTGARLTFPDGDGLDLRPTRPIRGVALSYALRMSRELEAIQQRADAMFARGDLGGSTLYAAPRSSALGSHSSSSRAVTDPMWDDYAARRRQLAAATSTQTRQSADPSPALRVHPTRISSTFATEYRDIAQRMMKAANHDNYASTVSLTIPKTGRLRLVPEMKAFFGKLNDRERLAALQSGCLPILFAWISARNNATGSTHNTSTDIHPHVLEAVMSVLEALPVRKEDLAEVKGFRAALDEISTRSDVGVDVRERCIIVSEKWRGIDPPEPSTGSNPRSAMNAMTATSAALSSTLPALPAIHSFKARGDDSSRKTQKRKLSASTSNDTEWSAIAVEYVKGKLYPLYKDSNGKMSKEQFKMIVKQVQERFRRDAASMQSAIVEPNGKQLSSVAKKRLMQLLDHVYRESRGQNRTTHALSAAIPTSAVSSYNVVPSSVKRARSS